ncbi:hypothetical protein KAFR_0D03610 [Kazachstania africana CBS 2517]|uniref:HTH TFE/IIEalpha-type domain-containing protein n=1 Tax=Kazachstania africana (strain ATCC 22294 / BCRC 22015 / CBS 2517 / CECT 1963 / NBRC 1671 / NRRL Y-8276) TaxID=1071382 RepID=H2AUF9_KAZAF|nr:hypothetical protein KAFR_0D03610 [Kazachstania africana CBS 2517]CCF58009.1 hypothetical protein KAFR_0D03610 [Kazachstania africana CBS 2517]
MDKPIDEIVKNLLKFVVRGFYGGSYILVIDAILFHSVLAEDDLKQLLSINKTELGPLIARLRSDRLISIHKQREYPPNSKSVERMYFYIKYPHAIDGIKWKVHQLVQRLKDDLDKNSAPNGYMCPICQTKYTQLEAIQLLNYDRTEFLCSLCDEPLIEDDSGKKNKEKQDKLNRLMDQIQPVIDYLKKIDDSRIEENTFEFALAKLIPPQNQSNAAYTYNPKKGSTMFRPGDAPMANVMGTALGNDSSRRAGANSQATLHVNITTASDEMTQRQLQERQAEEKRKQNAVPEWHKQSTIGQTALGRLDNEDEFDPQTMSADGTTATTASALPNGTYAEHTVNDTYYNNENNRALTETEIEERENEKTLNEYYAQLAKKQAEEEQEDEEEEDGEFEDEFAEEFEGEFEDVTDDNRMESTEQTPIENATSNTTNTTLTSEQPNGEENAPNNDDEDEDIEFEDV